MTNITDTIIQSAINEMSNEFDSHDLIFWLMQKHPQEYTKDLYKNRNAEDPIRELHRKIGLKLQGTGLTKLGKLKSLNVRCSPTENVKWKK